MRGYDFGIQNMFCTMLGLLLGVRDCVQFSGGVRAARGGSVCIIYFMFLLFPSHFLNPPTSALQLKPEEICFLFR